MVDKNNDLLPQPAVDVNAGERKRFREDDRSEEERDVISDPAEIKRILDARAKALAVEPPITQIDEDKIEVVEFLLAHERYGLQTEYIREIYPLRDLTPLPGTPSFVMGVLNVRGQIVSIVDLKKFFELPEKGLTDLNKIVIIQSNDMEFGILADEIVGVRTILLSELQTSLLTLTEIRAEYLKGVTQDRLVVLDAEKILSDKKIVVDDEIHEEK